MIMRTLLLTLLLPWSAAIAQRVERSRFTYTAPQHSLSPTLQAIAPPKCRNQPGYWLAQLLTGTGAGLASAFIVARLTEDTRFDDYRVVGDASVSPTRNRILVASTVVSTAAAVAITSPGECRAPIPALIGSAVAGLPFFMKADREFSAPIAIIFGIPIEALAAVIVQAAAK